MAADDAMQVKPRHPTESGLLVAATILFGFSAYLGFAELRGFYNLSEKDWDATKGTATKAAKSFIDELYTTRAEAGLKRPGEDSK